MCILMRQNVHLPNCTCYTQSWTKKMQLILGFIYATAQVALICNYISSEASCTKKSNVIKASV